MRLAPEQIELRDGRRVVLREATPDDAAEVCAFIRELSRTAPYIVTRPDEAPTPEEMGERIAKNAERAASLSLVACAGRRIVGDCVLISGPRRKIAHSATLGMGVVEAWRGCGLGRALLGRAVSWGRSDPALWRIELGVMHENKAAISLYESLGFEGEGRRRRAFRQPDGTLLDDLTMALWVGPEPAPIEPLHG